MGPENKRPPEITLPAILLGVLLSAVMGAANVYLGLKAGMTVSASIPAAVIAMGSLRLIGRKSILESNLVQTAASAGESLAAGIIFTMPALLLTQIWTEFDFWTTTLIALAGGLFGVLLMIPMRRVFIVENTELKYPEGVACAEVLRAGTDTGEDGEESTGDSTGVLYVLLGIAVGASYKFTAKFLGLLKEYVEWATVQGGRVFYIGAENSIALVAVGYIVGFSISMQIFVGGAIGWLIAIPMLGTEGVAEGTPVDTAYELWSSQVRYMGVGAMVVGGVVSIWKVRGGLVAAAKEIIALLTGSADQDNVVETERNISGRAIITMGILCVVLTGSLYYVLLERSIGITIVTTLAMVVMSFFFAAVASYIVGLVGNSNSPVSGMTITAVLGTGLLMLLFGFGGQAGMLATLGVAGIVCCVACTAGDVCNDLKTGYMVGASPRQQQIMQVIGVLVGALVMAPVMTVLHQGAINDGEVGLGGKSFPAPQASLFASIVTGFFDPEESLPLNMVAIGAGIGIALLVADFFLARVKSEFRLHVMPVAVGIYLPFGLAVPILMGGFINWLVKLQNRKAADAAATRGVLLTSGIIAGESLVGVLLGALAYAGLTSLNLWQTDSATQEFIANGLSLVALGGVGLLVYLVANSARGKNG